MARLPGWTAGIALVLVVVAAMAGGWLWWAVGPAGPERVVRVVLPAGSGSLRIGEILERERVIRSAWAWATYVRLRGWHNALQAGTYAFSPARPLTDIARQVHAGEVLTVRYTIPEGWNLQQMAHHFAALGFFKEEAFLAVVRGAAMERPRWLPTKLDRLEGFLFPSTYALSLDQVSPRAVVRQMLAAFERDALPLYRKSAPVALDLKDWVTLASLVEKEAAVAGERPRIAGVFAARLRVGMPLASDPTVEYGLGIRQSADRPLTYAEVRRPHPYNTYLNRGLPPTPIASPGLASLESVLQPESTPYLYFVARYDGTHVFSRTVAEHEQAKRRIRADRLRVLSAPSTGR